MTAVSILLAAVLLAGPVTYDCTLDPPRALGGAPGEERSTAIEIPDAGPLRFEIDLVDRRRDGLEAIVHWPGDPFQVAGRTAALPTGEGAVTFLAMSPGPCLFTESACATLVNLVDETPQRANVVLTPSALVRDEAGVRRPFQILLSGTCTRSETNR